jgi:hypothetical protein
MLGTKKKHQTKNTHTHIDYIGELRGLNRDVLLKYVELLDSLMVETDAKMVRNRLCSLASLASLAPLLSALCFPLSALCPLLSLLSDSPLAPFPNRNTNMRRWKGK